MRTESEVLKDFEKLGWKIFYGRKHVLFFGEEKTMQIYKWKKISYECTNITMHDHKLLTELFTIWKWI